MPILACRGKSQRIARVMAALALASFTAQSLPGAKQSKIGATASGSWAQDKNGNNAWDGTVTDGLYAWGTGADGEIFVYGDWNGDGRTKMGVYLNGTWVLDYNGNGILDDPSVDKVVAFGDSNYKPIVGDWNGDGRTKIGVYNSATGTFLLDYNGNYAWDGTTEDRNITWTSVPNTNEKPVIGDWNGDGRAKIGIYTTAGTWILDYNGNYAWDGTGTDKVVSWSTYASSGELPVVGDWNGDGRTKIGVYQDGTWIADYNGNYVWDGTSVDKLAFYGGPGYDPVVGDWNIDGKAKIAIYQTSSGNWTIDMNGNWVLDQYGNGDVFTNFGGSTFKPVVGAWIKTNGILISPAQSSTLSGSSVVFAWGGGVGVTAYTLDVGTYNGGGDIFSQNVGVVTGRQVNNIPMNGAIVYVKLGSQIDGSWTYDTRTFTAFPAAKASIVDPYPNPGAHLNAATVAFSWSGGNGVSEYSFDWAAGYIYDTDPATSVGLVTSTTANGIPVGYGNTTIYVRLGSRIGGAWQFNRYTYLQATTTSKAVMLSPVPQSTLAGSQVTFAWSAATNATSYQLQVGTTGFNSPNIFNGVVSGTSKTIGGIPTSGNASTIYVRLYSLGIGDVLDTTYVPLNQGRKAEIISPAPSSNPATPTVLGGPSVTFSWTSGIGVVGYRLQVGNAAGSSLYSDQVLGRGTSPIVTGLPVDGSPVIVRLTSDMGSSQLTADYAFRAAADKSSARQAETSNCDPVVNKICWTDDVSLTLPNKSGTKLYASVHPRVVLGASTPGAVLKYKVTILGGKLQKRVAYTGNDPITLEPPVDFPLDGSKTIYLPGPTAANLIDASVTGYGDYNLIINTWVEINGELVGKAYYKTRAYVRITPPPIISDVSPSKIAIGDTVEITITGQHLTDLTAITAQDMVFAIKTRSDTRITALAYLASSASMGQTDLTVSTIGNYTTPDGNVGATSSPFSIKKQRPSRMARLDFPGAPNGIGPLMVVNNGDVVDLSGAILKTNSCGVYRNFVYSLVDQDGEDIQANYIHVEYFTDATSTIQGYTPPIDLALKYSVGELLSDIQYLGTRQPNPCPGPNDNETFNQHFYVNVGGNLTSGPGTPIVIVGGKEFRLSTVINIQRGNFSGVAKLDSEITSQ